MNHLTGCGPPVPRSDLQHYLALSLINRGMEVPRQIYPFCFKNDFGNTKWYTLLWESILTSISCSAGSYSCSYSRQESRVWTNFKLSGIFRQMVNLTPSQVAACYIQPTIPGLHRSYLPRKKEEPTETSRRNRKQKWKTTAKPRNMRVPSLNLFFAILFAPHAEKYSQEISPDSST